MTFSPELADIRFGCGLSPDIAPPQSVDSMLEALQARDEMAARFPIPLFSEFQPRIAEYRHAKTRQRKAAGTDDEVALSEQARAMGIAASQDMFKWYGQTVMRWTYTSSGLRERLVAFWTDHFTAVGKLGLFRNAGSPFVEEIIRPAITGRFADMLIAVTTHPMMVQFLDQQVSVGPDSIAAQRAKKRNLGLNENLAREVLELHTLGVEGPYTQTDVRELAELLTGLALNNDWGYSFFPRRSQPGPETVLGKTYGGDPSRIEPIHEVLRDLAVHPATASHIARKLAVHFVSDNPDPALITHLTSRYTETGGDLMAVYAALLEHPAAWHPELYNVKPPFSFIASACRALAVEATQMASFRPNQVAHRMVVPGALMGQHWQRAPGPDGWPEEDSNWITPQGLSARVRWAMTAPRLLRPDLPDPRDFVGKALGSYASEPVRFAAAAAETRAEAVGLVLSAPAFQRR
ncbi:DUF1800 domain-containing protein [Seohaeicola saemankumensis]|nr:DUF1800 domain-containing protein [Seohaeicola saemankumensis]MCA0871237.1 DUF1800 domain-containing protein [Seohaeicola saemankumensis]